MTGRGGLALRLARAVVNLAAALAPAHRRERMRREWEAELTCEIRRTGGAGLVRTALGAFADASALRAIERGGDHRSEGEAMAGWTSGWLREGRVAVRSLLRAPGYSAVAVLTLALGLGGTAAIYTLLDRVVLDPLPYPESERLVRLMNRVPGVAPDERWHMSPAQYLHLVDHSATLEAVGLYRDAGAIVRTASGPELARVSVVTSEMLGMLGARAHLGRLLVEADDRPGAPAVAVVSHGFWTSAFGGDPALVGRTLGPLWTDEPAVVVGVLAAGVALPGEVAGLGVDVWTPMRIERSSISASHVFPAIARLAPGADAGSAEREIAGLTPRLTEAFPRAYPEAFFERYGFSTEVAPLKEVVVGDMARNLWILLAGVGLVLLVAGANVANLFLVRIENRRRELAVRTALGAGRGHVIRYLLAEGLALSAAGGLVALLVASWAVPTLARLAPPNLPRVHGVTLGGEAVVLTLALAFAMGLGLTLQPLLAHGRARGHSALQEGGRGGTGGPARARFRSVLVVGQVALALVLAVSAVLLVESMRRMTRVDTGMDPEGVLVLQLHASRERYPDDRALWRFHAQLLERVRGLPGVTAAGMSSQIPIAGEFGCTVQGFEDTEVYDRLREAGMTTCAGQTWATPGYFEALRVPVVAGRRLERDDLDRPGRAAVVVSRAFADRFWPGRDPIGQGVAPSGRTIGPFYEVVGVVGDVPAESVDGEPAIAVYYPTVHDPAIEGDMSWWWPGSMYLVVRSEQGSPSSLFPSIRRIVEDIDPNVPLTNVQEMREIVAASMARLSFTSLLLAVAAATALLLAAVGLYGVVSYAVTRRTREIGMRMAIGARPGQVEWMVVAQSLLLVGLGLAVGLAAALAGTRVLEGLLYGVEPTEPGAFAAAAALLTAVALLASWIPARRAARVDPSEALREV